MLHLFLLVTLDHKTPFLLSFNSRRFFAALFLFLEKVDQGRFISLAFARKEVFAFGLSLDGLGVFGSPSGVSTIATCNVSTADLLSSVDLPWELSVSEALAINFLQNPSCYSW